MRRRELPFPDPLACSWQWQVKRAGTTQGRFRANLQRSLSHPSRLGLATLATNSIPARFIDRAAGNIPATQTCGWPSIRGPTLQLFVPRCLVDRPDCGLPPDCFCNIVFVINMTKFCQPSAIICCFRPSHSQENVSDFHRTGPNYAGRVSSSITTSQDDRSVRPQNARPLPRWLLVWGITLSARLSGQWENPARRPSH